MEYSNPCGSSQPPFFVDNMSGSQFFLQDELLEISPSWIESVDPALRNQSPPIQQLWQRQQQQPLQRFMGEPERAYFTAPYIAHPSRVLARGMVGPSIPVSTLPQASRARMVSPAPSQDLRSTCSSERSPGAGESDGYLDISYYSPPQEASFSLADAAVGSSTGFPDSWAGQQAFPQLYNHNCVNMSQVHLNPDPQEVNFEADEGFRDIDLKSEYHMEVDNQHLKGEVVQQSYRYPSDEGIGESIKDGDSPEDSTTIKVDTGSVYDEDADGDAEDIIVAEHASDTEYSPKSNRSRRRRISKPTTLSTPRRSRIIKPIAKPKGKLQCSVCDHSPFKELAALQRHVASCHSRPFVCVFDFAGCDSTFASKNEWKRHVSSQHLNLSSWICTLGACAKVHSRTNSSSSSSSHSNGISNSNSTSIKGSEFNRKDLFTQHLRRMHTPSHLQRMTKDNPQWEDTLKALQVSCLHYKRQPPARLACPLDVCDGVFEGAACWDERMEHVGKHLEKIGTSTTGTGKEGKEGGIVVIRQVDDELLVNWALRQGIVERRAGGGFRLCGVGGGVGGNCERRGGRRGGDHHDEEEDDDEDEDAYGEEE